MAKHRYEVVAEITMTVEVDDEVVSDHYPGETVMTAHANPERFVPGTTFEQALYHAAIAVAADGRRLGNVDGWADFPDTAVQAIGAWPSYEMLHVREVPMPAPVPAED